MRRPSALIPLLVLASGCTASTRLAVPFEPAAEPAPTFSLFGTDGASMSEADVARLLSATVDIPAGARIAVLQVPSSRRTGYRYGYGITEDDLRGRAATLDTLRARLLPAGAGSVVVLPSLLVPNEPRIPVLREIAVRLQAAGLLIVRVDSDILQNVRLFRGDQFKAVATVEAVLLDVRTGAIPFTTVVTRDVLTQKQDGDLSEQDARLRAEQDAIVLAFGEMGRQAATFLRSP